MKELTPLSKQRLSTCEKNLQRLVEAINEKMYINVAVGYRGETEQNRAFAEGRSKVKFPNSKHNTSPSQAVDIYPIVDNIIIWDKFDELGRIIKETAGELCISVQWGGDWRMVDKPHIELKF